MRFWNSEAVKWLCTDGLLPLLGAAALFLLWGYARYLAAPSSKPFVYSWKEALDPMGWLYGASILAIQSGTKALGAGNMALMIGLYVCAGISLVLLLAAMTNRGDDATWRPKTSFQVIAIFFVFVILVAGYAAHFPAPHGKP